MGRKTHLASTPAQALNHRGTATAPRMLRRTICDLGRAASTDLSAAPPAKAFLPSQTIVLSQRAYRNEVRTLRCGPLSASNMLDALPNKINLTSRGSSYKVATMNSGGGRLYDRSRGFVSLGARIPLSAAEHRGGNRVLTVKVHCVRFVLALQSPQRLPLQSL